MSMDVYIDLKSNSSGELSFDRELNVKELSNFKAWYLI